MLLLRQRTRRALVSTPRRVVVEALSRGIRGQRNRAASHPPRPPCSLARLATDRLPVWR